MTGSVHRTAATAAAAGGCAFLLRFYHPIDNRSYNKNEYQTNDNCRYIF